MVINLSLISMNKCVLSEIYNRERGVSERERSGMKSSFKVPEEGFLREEEGDP
jgi:hypothetical protein